MSAASPPTKRKRMSHACTPCRVRKVKCDESVPKCSNCLRLGDECITIDPRRPTAKANRVVAQRPSPQSLPSPHYARETTGQNGPSGIQSDVVSNVSAQASKELLPVLPRFICGPKHILTQWLDLALLRLGIAGQYGLPSDSRAESINGDGLRTDSVNDFQVFALPAVPMTDLASGVTTFRETVGQIFKLPLSDAYRHGAVPSSPAQQLACHLAYAAVVVTQGDGVPHMVSLIMRAALSRLGHLMVAPSLDAVMVMTLLAMLYRCTDQPQAAWHVMVAALAASQTLGIHRTERHRSAEVSERRSAVWYSVYVLEKALSLEQERPSTLRDDECDQLEASEPIGVAILRLAGIQSRISERMLQSRRIEESATGDISRAIELKIQAIQESEQQLITWSDALPENLRPSRHSHSNQDGLVAKTFIAVQFHQTRFLLHRHALILSRNHNQAATVGYQDSLAFSKNMSDGYQTALSDCRDIVNVLAHAEELGAKSVLDTTHASLLAIYGLAVHLVKHPDSRRAAIDLELHKLATEIAVGRQKRFEPTNIVSTKTLPNSSRLYQLHNAAKSLLSRHGHGDRSNGINTAPIVNSTEGIAFGGDRANMATANSGGYYTPGDSTFMPTHNDNTLIDHTAAYSGMDVGNDFTAGQQASNDAFLAFGENFFQDDFVANTTDWEFLADIVGLPSM